MSTRIEWTDETWNPVTGCSNVSEGCRNCYARRFAMRLKSMGNEKYRNGFDVTCHESLLDEPAKWKKKRLVFVNSMSDLFHAKVPSVFIAQCLAKMAQYDRHIYQILTKRSGRLAEFKSPRLWPSNVWLGVTVENSDAAYRMDDLKDIPAFVKFISAEPLIGPFPVNKLTARFDWVIVGGEKGPGARRMKPEWVLDIFNKCEELGIPFFFKQMGGVRPVKTKSQLEKTWDSRGIDYKQFPLEVTLT